MTGIDRSAKLPVGSKTAQPLDCLVELSIRRGTRLQPFARHLFQPVPPLFDVPVAT